MSEKQAREIIRLLKAHETIDKVVEATGVNRAHVSTIKRLVSLRVI